MSNPKRHHYLPQFYLKGFCRDEYLWVYDRKTNQVRRQTPINTAIQSHYYSVEDEDGEKNTEIESFLSQIEGLTKPIIQKVSNKDEISVEEKEILSVFLAFLMNRVPDFEKSVDIMEGHLVKKLSDMMFSDENLTQSVMDRYAKETGNKIEMSAKELVDFHKRGAYTITIHRNESLRLMLDLSFNFADCFRQMDWGFLHAPQKSSYVTTDNPLFIVPPEDWGPNSFYGVGLITQGAKKVVTLSQKVCLIMYDHGEKILHSDINREIVSRINFNITVHTDRFLIGRDEALVKNLSKRARLSQWERKGRIQIG
jgi:hypothetical protein